MKIIQKELGSFRSFMSDRWNRKTAVLIVIAVIALSVISIAKDALGKAVYIEDSSGKVSGVVRDDENAAAVFPLRIEADVDGKKQKRDVTLTIDGKNSEKKEADEEMSAESLFDSELSEMLMKLSRSGGKKIMLPKSLPGGTGLIWRRGKSSSWPALILLAPILIWLLYLDGEKKKRDRSREKTDSVERELPAFNDQLLLLLGSGLIFRDAFRRIADGYRSRTRKSFFQQEIIGIEDETEQGVSDIVNVITRQSEAMGVSQFSRLAGVIRDNQLRGTDISGKLKTESEILWDLRKRNAEEKGRLAETKLTLPLAILLLVLVLVTAAPAMIQVQGG
ncbi:MAG: type II secretion system F family protein [Eubacterium sp.]|nr:type II secretion system F family protein [Eubacterium sp.]